MTPAIRILHLEDDIDDAEIILSKLKAEGLFSEIVRVETEKEFTEALDRGGFDIILADYSLPSYNGMSALEYAREKRPDLPFIFVSGAIGEERAISALTKGAVDYVLKNNLNRLVPAIRRALIEAKEISSRKLAERELKKSERKYKTLVENASDQIFMISRDCKVISANAAVLTVFGKKEHEIVGKHVMEIFQKDVAEKNIENLSIVFKTGRNLSLEEKLIISGLEFWSSSNLNPVKDENGEVTAVIGVVRDITARRQAEEEGRFAHEQMRKFAERLQEVREEERKKIAREIHDDLGGALTGMKIDFSMLQKEVVKINEESLKDAMLNRLSGTTELLDATIDKIRKIASNLRPGILDDLGIIAAMEWQLKDFQKHTDICCEWVSSVEHINMDDQQATALFRIFQEALTNVIRHANATELRVCMRVEENAYILEIEDNGLGITMDQIKNRKSLGLLSMRERTMTFGGSIFMEGRPGKGTKVTIEIPFKEIKNKASAL